MTFLNHMASCLFGVLIGIGTTLALKLTKIPPPPPPPPPSKSSSKQQSTFDKTGSFLSDILSSLWTHFEIAISQEIINSVQPIFATLPSPLNTCKFTKVSLGPTPISLDNCIVHHVSTNRNGQQYIQFDLDVVWDGNCDIRIGSMIGSFGVASVKLSGRMSFILQPLLNEIPLVGMVQYSFVNPPHIDMGFTGLAKIADVGYIKRTIQQTMVDVLDEMMVLPNRQLIALDESSKYFDAYAPPLGVAEIRLIEGRGFDVQKMMLSKDDVPDVFVKFRLGNKKWESSMVKDCTEPVWPESECHEELLFDHDQILSMDVMDQDKGSTSEFLGTAQVTVGDLLLAMNGKKEVQLLTEESVPTGAFLTVGCRMRNIVTGVPKILDDENVNGILTILLSTITGLPQVKEDAEIIPYYFAKVTFGPQHTFFTGLIVASYPNFLTPFRILLKKYQKSKTQPDVTIELFQGEVASDVDKKYPAVSLGSTTVSYADIESSKNHSWVGKPNLADGKDKPLLLECLLSLGVVKRNTDALTHTKDFNAEDFNTIIPNDLITDNQNYALIRIIQGFGFQTQRKAFGQKDVPDVYCLVKFGTDPSVWRTSVIQNSLSPVWTDEKKLYPLKDHTQVIHVHAWDRDTGMNDHDDDLGSARISVGKILLRGGKVDLPLVLGGKETGGFVTVECMVINKEHTKQAVNVSSPSTPPSVKDDEVDKQQVASSPDASAASSEPDLVLVETEHTNITKSSSSPSKPSANTTTAVQSRDLPTKNLKRTIRLTMASGNGFKIQKKRLGKSDIPDCYCKTVINDNKETKWKTSTIKNSVCPQWDESKRFDVDSDADMISIEVWDEDSGLVEKDDFLGMVSVNVGSLLARMKKEGQGKDGVKLELSDKKKRLNGCSIVVRCEEVTMA